VRVKTDDPQFAATTSANLVAAATPSEAVSGPTLTQSDLDAIASVAISQWTEALGDGDARLAALADVRFGISDLAGSELGNTEGGTILVDVNAAGYGWFVDTSPASSSEFRVRLDSNVFGATPDSPAYGHMDLVSVLTHELGHLLGFGHEDADRFTVMREDLGVGLRYTLGGEGAPVAAAEPPPAAAPAAPIFDPPTMPLLGMPNATIDWQAGGDDGWSVGLSPYGPQPAASASANFASFAPAATTKASTDTGFDRMGRDLLGKKK
jgi:hypothetical protein